MNWIVTGLSSVGSNITRIKSRLRFLSVSLLIFFSSSVVWAASTAVSLSGTASSFTCALPWGGTISGGQSVTAYYQASGTCVNSCTAYSTVRTCTNGTLSGSTSYQYGSCTPASNCTVNKLRIGVGVYSGTQSGSFSFSPSTYTARTFVSCASEYSCTGSGNTVAAASTGSNISSVAHVVDFTFSTRPTSVNVTLSGSATVGYNPTFYWVYSDGSSASISASCSNGGYASHYYTSWSSVSYTCTLPAP